MPSKKVVQDIIPSSRRSIKMIPLKRIDEPIDEEDAIYNDAPEPDTVIKKKRSYNRKDSGKAGGKFPKVLIFIIILISVAIIGFAISLLYSKAIVTITPEKIDLNVSGNFIAKKDSVSEDSLSYQIITVSEQSSTTIPATDGPVIQTKAKGTVTLYNAYSSSTQKIVAGTRLANNKGLIYKTVNSVVIPGKKTVSGKVVYGSVVVSVIADQFGQNYNSRVIDLAGDFRFIGYKGTNKYEGFFGRLKTDLVGGYIGSKKVVSIQDQKNATLDLQKKIETKLLSKVSTSVPNGYTMFTKSYYVEYNELASSTNLKDKAELNIKGTLYAVIFESKSLINFMAKKQIRESRLLDYKVDGLKDIIFKTINDKDFSPQKGNTLSFSLNGRISITGTINEKALKTKLLGVKVNDVDSVIKDNPSIKYAKVLLTPFWMRSFPNSIDNITIEYK